MLGKLMKYELKASARSFLPLYGALLIFALINRFFIDFEYGISLGSGIGAFTSFIYFALMVAMVVLTIIVCIMRFYKNLLSDEGYLMFTLPVKTWELVISRLFSAGIWVTCSWIVAGASILIFVGQPGNVLAFIKTLLEQIEYLARDTNVNIWILAGEGILFMLCDLLVNILFVYTAIAIGHLFSKHQILASFGAYVGLLVTLQAVAGVFVNLASKLPFNSWAYNNFAALAYGGGAVMIVISLLLGATIFAITNYILNNRLNLE